MHLTRFVCGAEKGVQAYAKKRLSAIEFRRGGEGRGEATPEAFGAVIKHANCIRANWQVTEVFATCTQSKLRGRENQSNALNANGELCLSEINFGITPLPPFPLPLPPPTTQSINRKSLQITQQILALEGAIKCGQFAYKYPGYAISETFDLGGTTSTPEDSINKLENVLSPPAMEYVFQVYCSRGKMCGNSNWLSLTYIVHRASYIRP